MKTKQEAGHKCTYVHVYKDKSVVAHTYAGVYVFVVAFIFLLPLNASARMAAKIRPQARIHLCVSVSAASAALLLATKVG